MPIERIADRPGLLINVEDIIDLGAALEAIRRQAADNIQYSDDRRIALSIIDEALCRVDDILDDEDDDVFSGDDEDTWDDDGDADDDLDADDFDDEDDGGFDDDDE